MEYEHCEARQNAIYQEFRAATATLTELKTGAALVKPCAGYIIALRHAPSVMGPFAHYTALVRRIVPTLRYDAENGHTTITVSAKQPLATFQPDAAVLRTLHRIAAQVGEPLRQGVRIDFHDWYFNQETIIVAGEPNAAFWEVGSRVQVAGKQHGLDLRMPWGAHMTAGRFTQSCNAEGVAALRQCMKRAPTLGISVPTSIHVGYYTTSEAGFALHA